LDQNFTTAKRVLVHEGKTISVGYVHPVTLALPFEMILMPVLQLV
jgi:hypothetical protein